jgi:hypothetical protein
MTIPRMVCPVHGCRLSQYGTSYGSRWQCDEPGCDVVCWGNKTSTPANQETRDLRSACHDLFDPLWRREDGHFRRHGDGKGKARHSAYLWLADKMGLPFDEIHFGMFTSEQCREAVKHIAKLIEEAGA